jgi:hypothetical protein
MTENVNKNKNLGKNIVILLLFLIPTWLIGVNIFFANSDKENSFDKGKAISLYPEAVLSINNLEQIENGFFTMHIDPQIIISPPKNKISLTMIEFAEPVPVDSSVKIYYANKKNKNLSEENSVFELLPKGSTKIILSLSPDIYTTLRYDIDIFAEWYEIEGIYVSERKRDNTLLITLIISVCIFILWILGIRTGRMDRFHEKAASLFKNNDINNTVKEGIAVNDATAAKKDTTDKYNTVVEANKTNNKETIITENVVKNKNLGRNIIILLFLLILTWLIGINIYLANSNTTENSFDKGKAISLYPEAVLSVNNCEQEENRFFTMHIDPQIIFSPPKNKISLTMIEFAEPVPVDSSVKIYYANKKNKNMNEENSVFELLPKGSTKIIISLPLDIYTTLRYDIDIFAEWYEIEGIYVSERKRDNTLLITLIISICIFILWILSIKTGRMDRFHEKATNLFKNNDINNTVKDTATIRDTTIVENTTMAKDTTVKDVIMVANTITVKANNTNKMFLIAMLLLIVLKLSLVMGNKIYPIPNAWHDDMLMYSRAVSISNGEWLGSYNNLILAKGAFFSIWLAFLHLLSVPMLIGNEILYIASCLFFIWCINNIVLNKKMLLLIFAVLLFNPATLGCLELFRIYRDGIFPALIIFVFAGTIGMFLKKDEGKKMLICSILSGIFLSAAWHTREDTFWVLPFVIVADIVIVIFILAEKKHKDNIKKYIYLILPFIILFISNLSVSSLNNIKYGRYITNDYMSKDFQGAYGALTRVTHEKFDYYNPVPEEVRMKIYQISPSFNELRPYLDEGPLEWWKDEGKKSFGWPLHDFYSWFMWALRDAVAACSYYENPQKAKEYYERLAKEVNNACDTGLLPSRTGKRATLASPFSREYIAPTLENILKTVLFVIRYDQIYYFKNNLLVDDELLLKVRDMEFYLNQLSWCKKNSVVLNGWTFDSSEDSEDIDIKIIDSKNQTVSAVITKSDSMDVYSHFNEKYKTALKARFNVKFDINSTLNYYLNISNIKGEQINILINNDLRGGSDATHIIYHIDNVFFTNKDNNTKVEKVKNIISNSLLKINKMINSYITLIGLLSLLILTSSILYRLFKRMEIYYYKEVIILWGLLLTFFARTVMIAYVHVSSFPAINVLYLSSSYPIMIIFNCISLCCIFSFVKKLFIKKQKKISQ